MTGVIEQIAADVAAIKAILEGGAAVSPAADKKETAAERKKREAAEVKASKPDFTAEQLRDKYIAVQETHGAAVAKALIKEMGFDKLANLVGDAPNWQQYWDAAEAKLAEEPEGDDNGGL